MRKLCVYLTPEEMARIEAEAKSRSSEFHRVSRNMMIREALARGLDALAKAEAEPQEAA